jgi:hypothetical protein
MSSTTVTYGSTKMPSPTFFPWKTFARNSTSPTIVCDQGASACNQTHFTI